jgi:addiction module HigA family antidote
MRLIDYSSFQSPLNHPGKHLKLEYLPAYDLSASDLAQAIGTDKEHTLRLLNGERSMTAEVALRLAKLFSTSPEFWMNLQVQHDLSREAIRLRHELSQIAPIS